MTDRLRKKDFSLRDKANIFLTPVSTYNLFPELDRDLFLGRKAESISYNVTKIILSHGFHGISTRTSFSHDEDEQTILVSTQRKGAELISLALQVQGFEEKGIETIRDDSEDVRYFKLTRREALTVENGVLMRKNFGGPPWE